MEMNIPLTVACLLGSAVLLAGCSSKDYRQGVEYMNNEQYEQAVQSFSQCPDTKDASALESECAYLLGQQYWKAGNEEAARIWLEAITDGEYADDAAALLNEISQQDAYDTAIQALDAADYSTAYEALTGLGNYKDAPSLLARFAVQEKLTGETVTVTDSLTGTITQTIEYLYDTEGHLRQIHSVEGYVLPTFPTEVLTWAYSPLMRSYATDELYTYDTSGQLQAITGLDAGSVVFQIDYVYDDDGRMQEENLSNCAQISRECDVTHYNYDTDGQLSFVSFDSDGYKRAEYTWNEDGTLSRLTTTHLMFPVTIDYSYENGRVVQADITRAKTGEGMQPYRMDVYSYNDDGTTASVTCTWAEGVGYVSSSVVEYTYGTVLTYHEK